MTHFQDASAIFEVPKSIVAQVVELDTMPISEIYALWQTLYQSEPPNKIRSYLVRKIAFKLQQNAFIKRCPANANLQQQRIASLIEAYDQTDKDTVTLPVEGTMLKRHFKGTDYFVRVISDKQFEFNDCIYSNLSVIAREITGTQWSGPAFFGLKKRSTKKRGVQ